MVWLCYVTLLLIPEALLTVAQLLKIPASKNKIQAWLQCCVRVPESNMITQPIHDPVSAQAGPVGGGPVGVSSLE